jgi:TetR/AcrR family transcriptional regulator
VVLTSTPTRRDPEATKERILNAALAEFSAEGFAGARIQAIAQRAGVNVRMLYHYFGEKDDLFRAILRRRFAERPIDPSAEPARVGAQMSDWFTRVTANPDWVRLSQWEALEVGDGPVVDEPERRQRWAAAVDRVRAEQASGDLFADLDPDLMLLALVALATFPAASPPVVRMLTGTAPTDPRFRKRYAAFLEALSGHLKVSS